MTDQVRIDEQDPAAYFLSTLTGLIAGGGAHLVDYDGLYPIACLRWGWRSQTEPLGTCIGRIDEDELGAFLDPDVAYDLVQRAAVEQGRHFAVTQLLLWKRLRESSPPALASWDVTRGRNTVRKVFNGQRSAWVHVRLEALRYRQTESASENRPIRPTETAEAARHDTSASENSANCDLTTTLATAEVSVP